MFEPIINCGFHAGENPECWDGIPFLTEKECEDWIYEMQQKCAFSEDEDMGGVYAEEILSTDFPC